MSRIEPEAWRLRCATPSEKRRLWAELPTTASKLKQSLNVDLNIIIVGSYLCASSCSFSLACISKPDCLRSTRCAIDSITHDALAGRHNILNLGGQITPKLEKC
eukprot:scaffold17452_cov127-Amphora_coffeaeformis.AAC.1